MASCHNERNGVFSGSRHKALTKQIPPCENRGAFSETTEGALFLPCVKDDKAPSFEGAFSLDPAPRTHESPNVLSEREHTGWAEWLTPAALTDLLRRVA